MSSPLWSHTHSGACTDTHTLLTYRPWHHLVIQLHPENTDLRERGVRLTMFVCPSVGLSVTKYEYTVYASGCRCVCVCLVINVRLAKCVSFPLWHISASSPSIMKTMWLCKPISLCVCVYIMWNVAYIIKRCNKYCLCAWTKQTHPPTRRWILNACLLIWTLLLCSFCGWLMVSFARLMHLQQDTLNAILPGSAPWHGDTALRVRGTHRPRTHPHIGLRLLSEIQKCMSRDKMEKKNQIDPNLKHTRTHCFFLIFELTSLHKNILPSQKVTFSDALPHPV